MAPPLQLDVVSDTICPWCFIGRQRLRKALDMRPGIAVDVRWRPYQLDPTIPDGGIDRRQYLEGKFGLDRAREMHGRLAEAGAAEGIDFAFDRIARTPNTINSHRLIRWAGTAKRQDDVVERLFRLYFTEGGDIEGRDSLVAVARETGMDADLVSELLAGDADTDLVRREVVTAQKVGVTGVPCFIFAGRFGIMGAQSPDIIADAIDRALAEVAEPAHQA